MVLPGKQCEPKRDGIALLDLDNTLIDSPAHRKRALAFALRELPETPGISDPVAFFTEHVYDLSDLYQSDGLALGNYRHQWNHPGWYITYRVLATRPDLRSDAAHCASHCAAHSAARLPDDTHTRAWKARFLAAYRQVECDERASIARAVAAFVAVKLRPADGANDLLACLTSREWIKVYVVSEGDPSTQWAKLVSSALSAWLPSREHLLTTGDATTTNEVRSALETLRGDSADRATFARQIVRLVERITRRTEKKDVSFYANVIRAIVRHPESARSALASMTPLLAPAPPDTRVRIAMLGDRQTVDIEPVSILPDIQPLTIRVLSPAYLRREPPDATTPHAPRFTVDTLAQAAAILRDPASWEICPSSDPPLFFWTIDLDDVERFPNLDDERDLTVGFAYVFRGCAMRDEEYPFVSRICAQVFVDSLASRKPISGALVRQALAKADEIGSISQRMAFASALLQTGAFRRPPLVDLQSHLIALTRANRDRSRRSCT